MEIIAASSSKTASSAQWPHITKDTTSLAQRRSSIDTCQKRSASSSCTTCGSSYRFRGNLTCLFGIKKNLHLRFCGRKATEAGIVLVWPRSWKTKPSSISRRTCILPFTDIWPLLYPGFIWNVVGLNEITGLTKRLRTNKLLTRHGLQDLSMQED